MDIKDNVAKNLIKYRKALDLTQADLAAKLNYSDKAVSKWERAESVPDIFILNQIADLFGITVDALISPPKEEKPSIVKQIGRKRLIIGLMAAGLVWLVAILCYTMLELIIPSVNNVWKTWLALIYAIPITFFIMLILTSVWGKSITNMIVTSLFVWTLILSIFLTLNTVLSAPPAGLWQIFLIGIPLQALTIFLFCYKKINNNSNKKHII